MKRLLLLSLCSLPLTAMQDKPTMLDYVKHTAAPVSLLSGTIMTTAAITGGGCTLFPPVALALGGGYCIKKAYDWRYKQEILDQAKGN